MYQYPKTLMKNKKFITIFHGLKNLHLVKDVGQIPYNLHKIYGYNSQIITYKNEKKYFLLKETKGLKVKFIKNKGKFFFIEKSILEYLWNNSKKIDILNLYCIGKTSLIYGLIYKFLNPKGILYIKSDLDNYLFNKKVGEIFPLPIKIVVSWFLNYIDIVSVETREGEKLLKKLFGRKIEKKLIYIPNGVDGERIMEHIKKIKLFNEKKDIILTIGRIGTSQKNNEMLLEAIRKIDLKGWKVYFVGSIEKNFKKYIYKYFSENPDLKKKIFFTGEILNRKKICEFYNNSKIFCLTSTRLEGFGIVLPEALQFGNYIIVTNFQSAKDLTNNEKIGKIIHQNSSKELKDILQKLINNQKIISQKYEKIIKFSKKFTWNKIIKRLYYKLNEIS